MNTPRQIPFARPWITDEDRKAVMEVLDGYVLTHGPQCKGFEADFGAFLGDGAHCVTVSSCMAALHLSYLHFGIGPGDEVIVLEPCYDSYVPNIELAGGTVVRVALTPGSFRPDFAAIGAAITARRSEEHTSELRHRT